MANTKKHAGKSTPAASKPAAQVAAPAAKPAPKPTAATVVRHTPVPKATSFAPAAAAVAAPAPRAVTRDMIAARAYEIWTSGAGGSEFDNWCRAEGELRAA